MKKSGIAFSLTVIFIFLFFLVEKVTKETDVISLMPEVILIIQGVCALGASITIAAGIFSLASYFDDVNYNLESRNSQYGESWNNRVNKYMQDLTRANGDFTNHVGNSVAGFVEKFDAAIEVMDASQKKSAADMNDNVTRFVRETNKVINNFYDNNMLELQKVADNQERVIMKLTDNQVKLQTSIDDITVKIKDVAEFVAKNNTEFFKAFGELNKQAQESFEEKELKWKSDMQYTIVQSHQAFTTSANDSHVRLITVIESLTKLFDSYIEEFEMKISENLKTTTEKSNAIFEDGSSRLQDENRALKDYLSAQYDGLFKSVLDAVSELRNVIDSFGDLQEKVLIGLDARQRELEQLNREDVVLLKEILANDKP